jgi:hypothetical protein
MNKKQIAGIITVAFPLLIIGAVVFLLLKWPLPAKTTEQKPETAPAETGMEINQKPVVDPEVTYSYQNGT